MPSVALLPPVALLPFVALLVAAVLLPAPVAAQSVDYGALEQLFGEPVTTSVTGKPQRAADAPANIEIVTQDDIRRSGATSIPDVLRFVAGVDVRENGFDDADVGIRGYNQASNPHLMVLIDGRQVYMVDYGRIVWAAIPVQLDEIRQIEIIKGPNSALYGFNAVGGVINIITYDPLRDRLNIGTVRAGTQSYLDGSVIGTGRIGDTAGVRLSLGGFQARDFGPGALGAYDREARQPPFTGTFRSVARWQINQDTEVFAEASAGDTRLSEQEPPGVFDTERLATTAFRAGINADTMLGVLSLSAYRSDAAVRLYDISNFGVPLGLGEYQTTYTVQASDLLKLGTAHTLRFELEYRENADDSGDLALGTISNAIYAASVMWDWQVAPAVEVTNAVRVDHLQLHYAGNLLAETGLTAGDYDHTALTVPSFNSGVVWDASQVDTLRFSVARGVQLPTLLEYGLQIPAGFYSPLAYSGTFDLNPSIVWNAEVDYDRALPMIGSTLRSALFLQRADDIIAWPFGAPLSISRAGAPLFFSSNVGYSTAAGTEVALKGHNAGGFHWQASYSLAATTNHTVLNTGAAPTGIVEYAHSAPEHVAIGGIGWAHERLELDLLGRWQSSYLDYRLNADRTGLLAVNVDDYVTLDARVGYRVTDWVTIALTAQQFNQSQMVETAGPPVERRVIASVTVRL
jgi:iron complex outermembrane receptor protein